MRTLLKSISPLYRQAMFIAVCQQLPLLVLSSLLLDGGQANRLCLIAALTQWAAAAMIVARRPASPTALDLGLIRWSYGPLLLFFVPLVEAVVRR